MVDSPRYATTRAALLRVLDALPPGATVYPDRGHGSTAGFVREATGWWVDVENCGTRIDAARVADALTSHFSVRLEGAS